MIGERLAELRKLNGDTQDQLAKKLHMSKGAICTWEQDRNRPSCEMLVAICKLYNTSADYLLGLTDYDPSDEERKRRQKLTDAELTDLHKYEEYLLWKRKNSRTAKP